MPATIHSKNKSTVRPKRKKLTAANADKYRLYQLSVQEPGHEVEFFDRAYAEALGRRHKPRLLREDFCGTFAVCCQWVKQGKTREAIGVDLDPEPMEWGRAHNLSGLDEKQRERVTLKLQDARKVGSPKVDIVAAQNFSFFLFQTREQLRDYFRAAYRNLKDRGVLVMDMMGGPECYAEDHEDVRRIGVNHDEAGPGIKRGSFEYVWEQQRFDPITHHARFAIHFRFNDDTELDEAFSYEWRFWTMPELLELLAEAGFEPRVYWEGTDEDTNEGDGQWDVAEHAPADPAWIAYVVAVKK